LSKILIYELFKSTFWGQIKEVISLKNMKQTLDLWIEFMTGKKCRSHIDTKKPVSDIYKSNKLKKLGLGSFR
jgi:hypothetical protein